LSVWTDTVISNRRATVNAKTTEISAKPRSAARVFGLDSVGLLMTVAP
jgi:hypothetical protein